MKLRNYLVVLPFLALSGCSLYRVDSEPSELRELRKDVAEYRGLQEQELAIIREQNKVLNRINLAFENRIQESGDLISKVEKQMQQAGLRD